VLSLRHQQLLALSQWRLLLLCRQDTKEVLELAGSLRDTFGLLSPFSLQCLASLQVGLQDASREITICFKR